MARMTKRESEKNKNGFFKEGVGTPCLATSRTNDRARLRCAQNESLNNNDNRVI